MNDSMNTAPAEALADSELTEVLGGNGRPHQHGGFPSSITLPDGTVLPLLPLDHSTPGQSAFIQVPAAIAEYLR